MKMLKKTEGRTTVSKMSFEGVLSAIAEDDRGKTDFLTPVSNLHADQEGNIAFMDVGRVRGPQELKDTSFDLTDWAAGQLLSRVGMPGAYFKKAKAADPELFSQHFNYWSRRAPNVNDVVRLRTRIRGDVGVMRGVVSDRYSVLNNNNVGDTLQQILTQGAAGEYEVAIFHMDDSRFHLRLTYPDLTKSTGILPNGAADLQRLGTDIVNSEVGAASFNLQAMIWRLVCENGLRRWDKDGDAFVQRHIHLRAIEFRGRVAHAMVNSLKTGTEFLNDYARMQEQSVENPFAVISKLAKEGGFSQGFTDTAKQEYEGDATAYGVINSFTRAARILPNESRLKAERFAGKMTRFSSDRWDKLSRFTEDSEG